MFVSLRSLGTERYSVCAFLVGINCSGEPSGSVSSADNFSVFQHVHPPSKALNNCLTYLPGMCYLLNRSSWCVLFQINAWDRLINVTTKGWSEGGKKIQEKVFLSTCTSFSCTHHSVGEEKEDQSWEDTRERTEEASHLSAGSVSTAGLPVFHVHFYFPTFCIVRHISLAETHTRKYI